MDSTFDIKDSRINTDELIQKIRENITKRRTQGAYTKDDENLLKPTLEPENNSHPLGCDIHYLNSNYDIANYSYTISSHRRFFGPILVKGRQLVNGELKRYVDPVIRKQKEFNCYISKTLSNLIRYIDERDQQIQSEISGNVDTKIHLLKSDIKNDIKLETVKINDNFNNIQSEIDSLKSEVESINQKLGSINLDITSTIDDSVNKKVIDTLYLLNQNIENNLWLINALQKQREKIDIQSFDQSPNRTIPIDYFAFSDEIGKSWVKISGQPANTPSLFNDALKFFKNCNNVLDIGCGNGYFLELLKDNNIGSYGIELNDTFVMYCRNKGLKVDKINAIDHLKSLPDNTLDGIFMCQVMEHLSIYEINELLKLCYNKLQPGSYLLISVPNIQNIIVSSNLFYMDPTHVSHLHPELLKFLLNTHQYRDIEERYYQPVPDDYKLKVIDTSDLSLNKAQKKIFETINNNISILNNLLFGYRDYAIICKK